MTLGEVARQLQRMLPDVLFGYGGRAFNINPALRRSFQARSSGQNARELTDGIAILLRHNPAPAIEDVNGQQ